MPLVHGCFLSSLSSSQLVLEFKASWSEPCKYMTKVLDGNPPGSGGLASRLEAHANFYALDIAVFKVLPIN